MKASQQNKTANNLLSALPANALSALEPHLHHRNYDQGSVLWDSGEALDQIFFLGSGMISITVPTEDGRAIEVGSVSREGAAGLPYAVEGMFGPTRGVVSIGGAFSSIATVDFAEAAKKNAKIAELVRFAGEWILLLAQLMAACNGLHPVDARFARWLALASVRSGREMIPTSQEEIADLLGVRRTTLSLIAQKLQMAGTIQYSRAKIMIRDPRELETAACACCAALGRRNWPATRLASALPSGSRANTRSRNSVV